MWSQYVEETVQPLQYQMKSYGFNIAHSCINKSFEASHYTRTCKDHTETKL